MSTQTPLVTSASTLDLPTLRTLLDGFTTDLREFTQGLTAKQQLLEQTTREIERYRGALAYIEMQQKKIEVELAKVTVTKGPVKPASTPLTS